MLFFGPPASGKGSAALELARVLSCEADTSWKCSCPACERHRYLIHSDLLLLGPRPFSAEIAAASSAFLREPAVVSARALFVRSLRKLQARFSPALMEDDPKTGKLSPLLQSLEEGLSEFDTLAAENRSGLEKICNVLVKDALKLESEGISDLVPVGHIRRAAYWCRLSPNGKRKTLLIENADRMKDEARNSLLKLLEEPPDTVSIVLTAQRREAIMPTILSRLRPYRFLKRDAEKEREVIRRVFRDSGQIAPNEQSLAGAGLIGSYLDSFLPQSAERLYPIAAFFFFFLARTAAVSIKKRGVPEIPAPVAGLGARYAPVAEAAGFERSVMAADVIRIILGASDNFEDNSFSRFLRIGLDMVSRVLREPADPRIIAYNDIFRKYMGEAETASGVLNQSPALAAEALFYKLKTALVRGLP
jgi:DNA polymerase-3 subunit gamma/tau